MKYDSVCFKAKFSNKILITMCVVYFRNQAFYSVNSVEINDVIGGGASGYHGYVKLEKTIELLSITVPFHLHHNTCQICTGLAHTTTNDIGIHRFLSSPAW